MTKNCLVRLPLLVLLLIVGCEKGQDGASSPPKADRGILRLPVIAATAVDSLDPIQSVEVVQYDIINQIFEGLVGVDENGDFTPALAERWEHTDDFRKWRFFLRDATFADDSCFADGKGRKLTPDDVIYSLRRGLSPDQGSKNSWALSKCVVGAAAFAEGNSSDVSGLRVASDNVIEIELVASDRYFLAALTVPSTYVVPREAVEKYGEQFGTHPVGSGPFRLAEWDSGQRLILKRNERYGVGSGWQPKPATIDEVRFVFFRAEGQVVAEFERGNLDVRPVVGADVAGAKNGDVRTYLKSHAPNAKVLEPGWLCKVHLLAAAIGPDHVFGTSDEARRALSQLFPRDRVERDALRGTGKAQASILPNVLYPDANAPELLPDAQEALGNAVAGKTVRVAYVSSRTNDIIVDSLKRVIEPAKGEVLLFPSTSINTLFGSLATSRPDLTLIYWSPYFPSIPDYLTALLSANRPVPNFTGFTNEHLDTLAAELRTASGRDAKVITADINEVLGQTTPWIPLYIETPLYLAAPRVEHFSVSPVSITQLRSVRLRGEP